MKKLLLVAAAAAAGFAFGYFAWKYYKGEKEKDEEGDDDVSRNEKIYSQKLLTKKKTFSWSVGLLRTVILIFKAFLESNHAFNLKARGRCSLVGTSNFSK